VRAPAGVALLAAGAVLCGCGGGGDDDDDDAQRTSRRPVAAASSADPGLRVWAAQGCGSCHTLAAAGSSGTFGPDLGETLRGAPRPIIRRAIVDPAAAAAPGYATGMMPEDYQRRMSAAELDRLVAFIDRSAR
jgi:mono/diheme cytochrome c family protein